MLVLKSHTQTHTGRKKRSIILVYDFLNGKGSYLVVVYTGTVVSVHIWTCQSNITGCWQIKLLFFFLLMYIPVKPKESWNFQCQLLFVPNIAHMNLVSESTESSVSKYNDIHVANHIIGQPASFASFLQEWTMSKMDSATSMGCV